MLRVLVGDPVRVLLAAAIAPSRLRRCAVPVGAAAGRRRRRTIRVQVREGGALVVREVAARGLRRGDGAVGGASGRQRRERSRSGCSRSRRCIARTYAVSNRGRHAKDGFDVCSTTHCQLYEPARLTTSRWAAAAQAAVQRTAGRAALVRRRAGARGVPRRLRRPYERRRRGLGRRRRRLSLPAPTDGGPAGSAHADVDLRDARPGAARARSTPIPAPRSAPGSIASRSPGATQAGRAEQILLRGTRTFVVRGEVFRDVVTRAFGVKSLRSTLFTRARSRATRSCFPARASATASACARPARSRGSGPATRPTTCSSITSRGRRCIGDLRLRLPPTAEAQDLRASDLQPIQLRRHRIHHDVDRELGVVLPLEALVPPVVVPLAAVVLVRVEHAEPAAVLHPAQVVVDDVVAPPVELVRGRRRAVGKLEEAAIERMLRRAAWRACRRRERSSASPARSSSRRAR